MSANDRAQSILSMNAIIAKKEEVERQRQAASKRMEILAQESELLANNLKKLEVEDKHWDAELAHLENVNVPILCLPNEITSLIFEMARGQSKFDDDNPSSYRGAWGRTSARARARPEVLVSHVCRHWRQMAIACPTIWSHIIIHSWLVGRSVGAAQRLCAYLTRSQGTLLDIVVNINRRSYQAVDCTDALREVLLAVVPHSLRWQRLLIWVHGSWNISPFSLLSDVSAPRLEIFEIGTWPTWRDYYYPRALNGMPDFVTLFQFGAPKLISTVICSQLLLPSQSTHISTIYIQTCVKRRPWSQFLALINLPNLRNLTLDGPIFRRPESLSPITRVVMHNLLRLRLGCPVASHYMLDTLSAPQLTLLVLFEMSDLEIVSTNGAPPQDLFPSLKTIALWKVDTTRPEDLLCLAIATPHVTSLIICDCEASRVLLLSLYEYSFMKHPQLWPQLQKLTYLVSQPALCFANRNPKTYKEAREILMQLVDWRLENFACKCTLWIKMTLVDENGRDYEEIFYSNSLYGVPLYDDSYEEEVHWEKLTLPYKHSQLIPWPEKGVIGAGYYGKLKFTDDCLMFPHNLDY